MERNTENSLWSSWRWGEPTKKSQNLYFLACWLPPEEAFIIQQSSWITIVAHPLVAIFLRRGILCPIFGLLLRNVKNIEAAERRGFFVCAWLYPEIGHPLLTLVSLLPSFSCVSVRWDCLKIRIGGVGLGWVGELRRKRRLERWNWIRKSIRGNRTIRSLTNQFSSPTSRALFISFVGLCTTKADIFLFFLSRKMKRERKRWGADSIWAAPLRDAARRIFCTTSARGRGMAFLQKAFASADFRCHLA